MACLLKTPKENSPGIVSFTTQEELLIRNNKKNLDLFKRLKNSYITCLHFNWHNFDYYPDQLFDIHFAGKDDLIIKNKLKINLFPLDACNFCPSYFEYRGGEKYWDILYIARSVFFKGIPDFFNSIRLAYDQGKFYRVLFLCPVPPDKRNEYKLLRREFEKLFTLKERSYFNFLPLFEDYPFFFDLETLSHFYKNAKIFVHTAPDERRCRVAAYAFSCGIPVVGKENVGSILNDNFKKEPIFFEVINDDFCTQIELALAQNQYPRDEINIESMNMFKASFSKIKMKTMFKDYFEARGFQIKGKWFCEELNLRLGSHFGLGKGPNLYPKSIEGFLIDLMNEKLIKKITLSYPEKEIISLSTKGLGVKDKLKLSYKLKNKLKKSYETLKGVYKNLFIGFKKFKKRFLF